MIKLAAVQPSKLLPVNSIPPIPWNNVKTVWRWGWTLVTRFFCGKKKYVHVNDQDYYFHLAMNQKQGSLQVIKRNTPLRESPRELN